MNSNNTQHFQPTKRNWVTKYYKCSCIFVLEEPLRVLTTARWCQWTCLLWSSGGVPDPEPQRNQPCWCQRRLLQSPRSLAVLDIFMPGCCLWGVCLHSMVGHFSYGGGASYHNSGLNEKWPDPGGYGLNCSSGGSWLKTEAWPLNPEKLHQNNQIVVDQTNV